MDKMTKYHIGVILTGALLCFAPASMSLNTWGVFMVPISTSLGVSTGMFSLQPSLLYLSAALFAPIGGRLIERFSLRIVLTGASLVAAAALFIDALGTQLWHFYLVGVLQGSSGVVLIALMLPNLVSRWFKQKMGTIVGLCISMAGLGGALWAFIGGKLIVLFGWRMSCMALGLFCLAIALPACLFFLRDWPSDVCVRPYGATADEADKHFDNREKLELSSFGIPAKIAFGTMIFIAYSVGIGLLNGGISLSNLAPAYVYHLADIQAISMDYDQVVMAASSTVLCTQAAQAVFKITFGFLADKNAKLAYVLAVGCGIISAGCFLTGRAFFPLIFVGSILLGAIFAVIDVLSPVLIRQFFGERDYPRIYARFAMIANLIPAFSILGFSALSTRSWTMTFIAGGACLVITLVCGLYAMARSKGLKQRFGIEQQCESA